MAKREKVNPYAKREMDLANALLNAGKPTEENNEIIKEDETAVEQVETKDNTVVEEVIKDKEVEKLVEVKSEPVKQPKEEKVPEQQDLFTIRKKLRVKKGQKNLTLKEENIEALTSFARKYGFNENEVVDHLIENYLKLIKIK